MTYYIHLLNYLGEKGALRYLKDYHESRVDLNGSFDDAVYLLDSRGHNEKEIMQHAKFMDECGSDLLKYKE